MAWFFYIVCVFLLAHIIASCTKKHYSLSYTILLILALTPSQLEFQSSSYAPSIFSFFYSMVLERDFSTRVLRPLIITVPVGLIGYFVVSYIKKRFF